MHPPWHKEYGDGNIFLALTNDKLVENWEMILHVVYLDFKTRIMHSYCFNFLFLKKFFFKTNLKNPLLCENERNLCRYIEQI